MNKIHPLVSSALKQKTKELHCIKGFVGKSHGGVTTIFTDLGMNFCYEVDDASIVEVINSKEIQSPQLVYVTQEATVAIRGSINPAFAEILSNKAKKAIKNHPDCHGDTLCNDCMADPDTTTSLDRFLCKLTAPGPMTGELFAQLLR